MIFPNIEKKLDQLKKDKETVEKTGKDLTKRANVLSNRFDEEKERYTLLLKEMELLQKELQDCHDMTIRLNGIQSASCMQVLYWYQKPMKKIFIVQGLLIAIIMQL